MTEKELVWSASMAPRVSEYPFNPIPKIAFMFLVKGDIPFAPLWEKFFKGHEDLYSIYVHASPSYLGSDAESWIFRDRRIPSKEVQWGKFNMVEAERRLIANALLDISNQRFILLSESCIPLFNFSTIYSYLMNTNKSFVEVYDSPTKVGRGRYNDQMKPQIELWQWRKGSQWFEMDRDTSIEIISDTIYYSVFEKNCEHCYANEHYIPTLMYIKRSERSANRSLTWAEWSRGGAHPRMYKRRDITIHLLNRLRSAKSCEYNGKPTNVCYLFARKFLPETLDRLLMLAPTIMGFD